MARTVKSWVGKTDDTPPPASCKRRILDRQEDKCAITGKPFTAKEKPKFDHITPLWMGGKNCEENLQAIHGDPHDRKSAVEATVRAKVYAIKDKNLGLKSPPKGRGFPKTAKPPKPVKFDMTTRRSLFEKEYTP